MGQNFAGSDNPMTLRRIVNDLETKLANKDARIAALEDECGRLRKAVDITAPGCAALLARAESAESALAEADKKLNVAEHDLSEIANGYRVRAESAEAKLEKTQLALEQSCARVDQEMELTCELRGELAAAKDCINRNTQRFVDAGIGCKPNDEFYLLTAVVTLALDELAKTRGVLRQISSCISNYPGDVVDLAQKAISSSSYDSETEEQTKMKADKFWNHPG